MITEEQRDKIQIYKTRVRILEEAFIFNNKHKVGDICKVTGINDKGLFVAHKTHVGHYYWDHLEVIQEDHQFKVGDKVRLNSNCTDEYVKEKMSGVLTIDRIDHEDWMISASNCSGRCMWAYPMWLDLVKEEAKPNPTDQLCCPTDDIAEEIVTKYIYNGDTYNTKREALIAKLGDITNFEYLHNLLTQDNKDLILAILEEQE